MSDHTPGPATVLGAITLGARVIEKHFTDDNDREGPDHKFSMNPQTWREMVDRSRELEYSLGVGAKRIEDNEKDTVVVQRRSIRAKVDLEPGDTIDASKVEYLRPAPADGLEPFRISEITGSTVKEKINAGDCLKWKNIQLP